MRARPLSDSRLFTAVLAALACSAGLALGLGLAGCGTTEPSTADCSTNTDCPADAPFCIDGDCRGDDPGEACESDEDCEGGTCNTLTGRCDSPQTCTSDDECDEEGMVCTDGLCEPAQVTEGCETTDDCDIAEICDDGACVTFDETLACLTDEDCPRDHVCNVIDGECQGCFNDAYCLDSLHGPKCDTDTHYCYAECGGDAGDCGTGMYCNTDVGHPDSDGGICAPACETRQDCDGGLICTTDGRCVPCQSNDECCVGDETSLICGEAAGLLCESGRCVDAPSCTQAECEAEGAAYFCDTATGLCVLGCTHDGDADPSVCDGLLETECNICPNTSHVCQGGQCATEGETCDPATCGGAGCGADEVCDTVTCSCVVDSGGTPTCSVETFCQCPDGYSCDEFVCIASAGAPVNCTPN